MEQRDPAKKDEIEISVVHTPRQLPVIKIGKRKYYIDERSIYFYTYKTPDGLIHIQDIIDTSDSLIGKHHVYTLEDFKKWSKKINKKKIIDFGEASSCVCGLEAGEKKQYDDFSVKFNTKAK
jgi:hypothetical protein